MRNRNRTRVLIQGAAVIALLSGGPSHADPTEETQGGWASHWKTLAEGPAAPARVVEPGFHILLGALLLPGSPCSCNDPRYSSGLGTGGSLGGWSRRGRVFYGPDLEFFFGHHDLSANTTAPLDSIVTTRETDFHLGLAYRVGVDVLAGERAALWLGGGAHTGIASMGGESDVPVYVEVEPLAGARIDLDGARLYLGAGPTFGIYEGVSLTQVNVWFALEAR